MSFCLFSDSSGLTDENAISQPARMHPRIAELIDYVDAQTETLRTAYHDVPPDQRGARRAPGRWSPAENVQHLTIVERRLTQRFATLIEQARALPLETETTSVLGTGPAARAVDRSSRFTTSEHRSHVTPIRPACGTTSWPFAATSLPSSPPATASHSAPSPRRIRCLARFQDTTGSRSWVRTPRGTPTRFARTPSHSCRVSRDWRPGTAAASFARRPVQPQNDTERDDAVVFDERSLISSIRGVMATLPPMSLKWPADRALLLVHGIGSARPGDYGALVAQLTNILADQPKPYAIYVFYYDQVNDWFAEKGNVPLAFASLVGSLRSKLDATNLGNVVADFAGDVIWPILLLGARETPFEPRSSGSFNRSCSTENKPECDNRRSICRSSRTAWGAFTRSRRCTPPRIAHRRGSRRRPTVCNSTTSSSWHRRCR